MTATASSIDLPSIRNVQPAPGVDVAELDRPRFVRAADGFATALSLRTIIRGHGDALNYPDQEPERISEGLDYIGAHLYAVVGDELLPARIVLARPQTAAGDDYLSIGYAILVETADGTRYVADYNVTLDGRA